MSSPIVTLVIFGLLHLSSSVSNTGYQPSKTLIKMPKSISHFIILVEWNSPAQPVNWPLVSLYIGIYKESVLAWHLLCGYYFGINFYD